MNSTEKEIHMHQNYDNDLDCPVTRRECTIYRKSAHNKFETHDKMINRIFEKIDSIETKVDQGFQAQRNTSYKEIAFLVFIAIAVLSGRYMDIFGAMP